MRFSEILLGATAITGAIWALDVIFLRHRRHMYILAHSLQEVKEPWWVEYAKSFFPILLIVFVLRSFLAEPFRIPSGSMKPTLLEGDFIVVNKYVYGLRWPLSGYKIMPLGEPKRGDVIVFKHIKRTGESIDMIKRIIGLPNDRIQYKDKVLYVNGDPVIQDFIKDTTETNSNGDVFKVREMVEHLGNVKHKIYVQPDINTAMVYSYENVVVPSNCYYVVGDNRDNSVDSRMWGFVKDEDIQGRAFGVWMSWNSADHQIRWDRLMTDIK